MLKISLEYWNELAHQILLISSLLSGFSIALVANLLVHKSKSRITISTIKIATIATGCFLITVFAMTKIIMMTTNGYPFEIADNELTMPRTIGSLTFFLGIVSLSAVIALAGWTKSKSSGIFTTIVGVLTLLAILSMLVR